MNNSSSPNLTCCPPYSGKRTLSPAFTVVAINFPFASYDPGPVSTIVPYTLESALLTIMPDAVLV